MERHNALIRSALQRFGSQVIKDSLVVSFVTAQGFVTFIHNALISINNDTPYQALLGRQSHFLPPVEGGYHGGLDQRGQNNLVSVREIVAVAIVEAIATQRIQRDDTRKQTVAQERAEHQPGDLVDIWYDPLNKDIPGWRGPALVVSVDVGGGNIIVRFQGRIFDCHHQAVRMHVLYLVYMLVFIDPKQD